MRACSSGVRWKSRSRTTRGFATWPSGWSSQASMIQATVVAGAGADGALVPSRPASRARETSAGSIRISACFRSTRRISLVFPDGRRSRLSRRSRPDGAAGRTAPEESPWSPAPSTAGLAPLPPAAVSIGASQSSASLELCGVQYVRSTTHESMAAKDRAVAAKWRRRASGRSARSSR